MQFDALKIISDREWILTNRLGGYALGFGNMINKRKYNGLLIASSGHLKRTHILSSIEEKLEGESNFFYLDSNYYPNCIYPNGHEHIVRAWLRPYPCALYSTTPFREDYLIFKEIFLVERQNAVVIKYTNLGKKQVFLTLHPKFTMRDHHLLNLPGTWDNLSLETEVSGSSFRVKRPDSGIEAYGYLPEGEILPERVVYRSNFYPMEANRGYDASEDLISPVRLKFFLPQKKSSYVIFSCDKIDKPKDVAVSAEKRYKKYPLPNDHPDRVSASSLLDDMTEGKVLFDKKDYDRLLELAAEDFIVGDSDVIAGYPWFGAWGRDTLISMGGFKFLNKGEELAVKILERYGAQLNNGRLPNTFGEGDVGLNYDSVDAPLWYVMRCYEYAPKNSSLFANVSHIILNYIHEDSHPFFVADDGLVEIRRGDHALTWMDAKVYNTPVTPRWGKPVEINALWFNSLMAARNMAKNLKAGELKAGQYTCTLEALDVLIEKVRESLKKFVGFEFLADRIEEDHRIWEVRPNAVIALSLPFDFVEKEMMVSVWRIAKEKLLTQYGLRTLDPSHTAFKQKYIGNTKQRDLAYHQGTVWTYLLLPFVRLAIKALKDDRSWDEISKEIAKCIWTLKNGMLKGEMASYAEIWDGVDPYFSKGCPAQAWSVFTLCEIENILKQKKV